MVTYTSYINELVSQVIIRKKKINGMNFYKKELRTWPHPRSKIGVETLAKFRGLSSNIKFAEAFEVGRLFLK